MKSPVDPIAFVIRYGDIVSSKVDAKHIIFSQGEAADSIFYLEKGEIQLTVVSMEGKEAIIGTTEAGDFCGEGCLVGEPLRMWTATAITECVVTRMEKATVLRAIHEDPSFSEFLATYVLKRSARLTDALVDQFFNSSERRLARILLLLANYGKEGHNESVIGKIDQETLAQMIGATRNRVNFFMNKFRRLGMIEYNGQIHVHSSLLRVLLHDPAFSAAESSASPQARDC
jgi:CRP/FNR family cyclic AMP-dependent transcriptional regulator